MSTGTMLTDEQLIMNLRDWRKSQGFNQQQLAEKIGIHYLSIGRWERGESRPTSKIILKKIRELMFA
jgi:transcriptional regulator with XRE-family HTH domain